MIWGDPAWETWSAEALMVASGQGPLVINPIVYAEVSVGYREIEACEAAIGDLPIMREPIPYPAAFLAGKAFLSYRRQGGARRSPRPDFFIGAHAAVAGIRLLTRDPARYATYFPGLALVTP